MSVISTIIIREENRNKNMISEYAKELEALPKGSLKLKNINGKDYYYLVFRNGNKVVSKYIGKDEESFFNFKRKIIKKEAS